MDNIETLRFKKYRIKSINKNIDYLELEEGATTVKFLEYVGTHEFDMISLSTETALYRPDEVDASDAKVLDATRSIIVSAEMEHRVDTTKYLYVREGEQVRHDARNCFVMVVNAE